MGWPHGACARAWPSAPQLAVAAGDGWAVAGGMHGGDVGDVPKR
jgi:hypothetical protein